MASQPDRANANDPNPDPNDDRSPSQHAKTSSLYSLQHDRLKLDLQMQDLQIRATDHPPLLDYESLEYQDRQPDGDREREQL